jgi:mannan endo-1,6-alpha-mannosidase
MFKGSSNVNVSKAALTGCQAQYAFQRNWFPDPIAGLFSYQTWNGMDGFWQDGIAIETMANTMHYGNHTRYFSVVKVKRLKKRLEKNSKN